jgi:hypothetical protein
MTTVVNVAAEQSVTPSQRSATAIEPARVTWIAVSPTYPHSGVVAAVGTRLNCRQRCGALWVSRDGGASWRRAEAHNWVPRRLVIALDGRGREVFYGSGATLLMRSDDLGESFNPAGSGGMPTVLPTQQTDGAFVAASLGKRSDYVVLNGNAHDVEGSGDPEATDTQFALSPTYPDGGAFSPVVLASVVSTTGRPMVLRCTADFTCRNAVHLSQRDSALATGNGTTLTLAPDYPEHGTVFADTTTGLEKSTDGGATFKHLSVVQEIQGVLTYMSTMALAPAYREDGPTRTAYVGVRQVPTGIGMAAPYAPAGLYKTEDGGTTWTTIATTGLFVGGATAVAVAPDGRLFAGYSDGHTGGLVCSLDDGRSWQSSCPASGDRPVDAAAIGPSLSTAASHPETTGVIGSRTALIVFAASLLTMSTVLGWVWRVRRQRQQHGTGKR